MSVLSQFIRVEFAPPRYLAPPIAGIDISTSGIKLAVLAERLHGLELASYGEYELPVGAVVGGEIRDPRAVADGLRALRAEHRIAFAHVSLPETRGYLFEADAPRGSRAEQRVSIEQKLDEYVPLPADEILFDIASPGEESGRIVGIGYARRVVEETLAVFDDARIRALAVESETFALPRALLPEGAHETVLIIDIGKTTTKLLIVTNRVPRYVTTLETGGQALTAAAMRHFGVDEEAAKRVKAEEGLAATAGDAAYREAMREAVGAIRDEIGKRLEYWQTHAAEEGHPSATRALLVGGNATVRGLPEYLEDSLSVPVTHGDVFTNFAPRESWRPPLPYMESLAYGTAIGLALRAFPSHA